MKTVDTQALSDHLQQQVTGLVTCWEIERVDGKNFYFTDADEDLTVDNQLYSSIGAYKRTAIESTSTLSVDNLEVVGLASDLALPAQDLRNGLFDNARVSVFMAAWSERVPGKIRLRRGFFGEVQTLPNETFQVELRGLLQRLSYNYMEIFSATCLYDLGSPECTIVIKPDQVARSRSYSLGDVVIAAQSSAIRFLRYDIDIGDADFTIAANVGDFSTSEAWYNSSALGDMILSSGGAFSPPASVRGSGSGQPETLTQIIDLNEGTTLPNSVILAGNGAVDIELYRKNENGDLGRVNIDFRDDDGTVCTMGSAARTTSRQRYTAPFSIAGDFTASFWINPDNGDRGGIIAGGSDNEATLNTGSHIYYENGLIRLEANYLSPTSPSTVASTPNDVNVLTKVFTGQWNHVVVRRTGTTVDIFINFELMARVTNSNWTGDFFFEDLFSGNTESTANVPVFDNGQLDDIRIYDVAKDYSDIVIDAKNDPALPDANLLRWFSFDDNTVNDQTGNDPTNYGAGVNVTYAVSLAPFNGTGVPVGYSSGNTDVGSNWTRVTTGAVTIPPHATQMNISLTAVTGGAAFFDNISGVAYDTTQEDSDFLPDSLNNVYWECTGAGTTSSTYPNSFVGGAGTVALDGTVGWTARNAWLRSGRVTSSEGRRIFTADVSDSRGVDAWYQGGTVIFSTGENAGVAMEVKSWVQSGGQIELFLSVPSNIAVGDQFLIYPGCDKSRISCAAIFDNMINFFGFPDIPGQDALYQYPNSKA